MEHRLDIEKVIAGGQGLGHLADGMVIMVPAVLPGERVLVHEIRSHRGYKEALPVRVLTPSPDRIVPPCPYAPECGGCALQHAAAPAQAAIKEAIVRETLARAHLPCPDGEPSPILLSAPFGYRHRVRLHLDEEGRLGFHQAASNRVVPIRRCLLATDRINDAISALADLPGPALPQREVEAIELLQCPTSGELTMILHPRGRHRLSAGAAASVLHGLADHLLLRQGRELIRADGGQELPTLSQTFSPAGRSYRLNWDPGCFFQVNADQNSRLLDLVFPRPAPHHVSPAALDLFCGMGNFSIPLGLGGAAVTGVEHNSRSTLWAKRNCREAGLTAVRFITDDVERRIHSLIAAKTTFDLIFLDPPRQGLGRAATLLPRLRAGEIVYVSCDPATMARDLALITAGCYRLTGVRPVDMFPQTHHIECVAFLERN